MGVHDLVFVDVATAQTIYDPYQLGVGMVLSKSVRVTNLGTENLTNLGLFIQPATNLGSIDDPADYPPETDFQDLLTWGQATVSALALSGGLKVDNPTNGNPSIVTYFSRSAGFSKQFKIPFIDLVAGASAVFILTLEIPPGVLSRRVFVDLKLE